MDSCSRFCEDKFTPVEAGSGVKGRPFGSEEFIRSMEKKVERRFMLKPPGRLKKKKNK